MPRSSDVRLTFGAATDFCRCMRAVLLCLLLLQCDLPWSAPFLDSYKGGNGKTLNLTMCNWYLPQGPGVPALYRWVWHGLNCR
jgi:hypothetical protein